MDGSGSNPLGAENTLNSQGVPGLTSASGPVATATVAKVSRTCARPGCSATAVATLSYVYATGVVQMDDLAAEAHPMVHDLCDRHAGSLRVPLGWELVDLRGRSAQDQRSSGSVLIGA